MATATVIDRHAIVLSRVTLNGAPAQIIGIRDDYATVVPLRGGIPAASFSWQHADKVVRTNGNFQS